MPIAVTHAVEVVRESRGDGLDAARRPVVGVEGGRGTAGGSQPVPEREMGRTHFIGGRMSVSERGRFSQRGEAGRALSQSDLRRAPDLVRALGFAHQVQRVREAVGALGGREGVGRVPRGEREIRHLERRERRPLHVAVAELSLGPLGGEFDRLGRASLPGE